MSETAEPAKPTVEASLKAVYDKLSQQFGITDPLVLQELMEEACKMKADVRKKVQDTLNAPDGVRTVFDVLKEHGLSVEDAIGYGAHISETLSASNGGVAAAQQMVTVLNATKNCITAKEDARLLLEKSVKEKDALLASMQKQLDEALKAPLSGFEDRKEKRARTEPTSVNGEVNLVGFMNHLQGGSAASIRPVTVENSKPVETSGSEAFRQGLTFNLSEMGRAPAGRSFVQSNDAVGKEVPFFA